ncbi:MAG: FAD-dependent oxidoreductase, partial [Eubacteriales bacterium]
VKKVVSIPVIAANLIRSPEQAEHQLQTYVQDFVSLGRPTLADPYWVKKVEQENEEGIKRCMCCLYCIESMQNNAFSGSHGRCSVNPMLGRETEKLPVNGDGKTVIVVGAGPGGLMASELLAKRGFHTILLEQGIEVGGQIMMATDLPHKEKIHRCVEDLHNAVVAAGVEIVLNTKADKELIESYKPYAVIIATGGFSLKPKSIPGISLSHVCSVTEVQNGTVSLKGRQVAVIGSGMTGLETAELLAEQGNRVFVVEMANTIAPGTWMQHVDDIMPRLKEKHVEFYTSKKLTAIHRNYISLETADRKKTQSSMQCEQVVLSLGVASENELYRELKSQNKNIFLIGDACKAGRIAEATEAAYKAVAEIE